MQKKLTAPTGKPKASQLPIMATPQAKVVTQEELLEKAFAAMYAAFLPQIESLRSAPGSGRGTISRGVKIGDDLIQVTVHVEKSAAKSR